MSKHFERDLEALERQVLTQASIVEVMIQKASRALREIRPELAAEVLDREDLVDRQEVEIEENCLKILALHQPVAIDLRRTTTILRINCDLERIADLAVNLAQRAQNHARHGVLLIPGAFDCMTQRTIFMVGKALDALVNLDVNIARDVCRQDEEVDNLSREVIHDLRLVMRSQPDSAPAALNLFSASLHLERIADHATNIAEDVIYLVDGDIGRHKTDLEPLAQPN